MNDFLFSIYLYFFDHVQWTSTTLIAKYLVSCFLRYCSKKIGGCYFDLAGTGNSEKMLWASSLKSKVGRFQVHRYALPQREKKWWDPHSLVSQASSNTLDLIAEKGMSRFIKGTMSILRREGWRVTSPLMMMMIINLTRISRMRQVGRNGHQGCKGLLLRWASKPGTGPQRQGLEVCS